MYTKHNCSVESSSSRGQDLLYSTIRAAPPLLSHPQDQAPKAILQMYYLQLYLSRPVQGSHSWHTDHLESMHGWWPINRMS
jgi:hypothetical protein